MLSAGVITTAKHRRSSMLLTFLTSGQCERIRKEAQPFSWRGGPRCQRAQHLASDMGRKGHPFLAGSPSLPQLNDSALALRRLAGVALESLENDLARCRSPSVAKRGATRVVIDFICWWRPHAIPPTQRGASVAHLGGPIDVRTAGAATLRRRRLT